MTRYSLSKLSLKKKKKEKLKKKKEKNYSILQNNMDLFL